MKFKVRQALKKLQAMILVAAMVITLLPAVNLQQAEAGIASGAKTINYGASVFSNPDLSESPYDSSPGRWGMLFLGNIKWRVLHVNDNSLFLFSNVPVSGSTPFGDTPGWADSSVRSWLNQEFLTNSFSDAEKALIMDTPIEGNTDKFFLLTQEDAANAAYGMDCRDSRVTVGSFQWAWWLRNVGVNQGAQAAVNGSGEFTEYSSTTNNMPAVRPACNINVSDIFMTSAIGTKESATVGAGYVETADATKEKEWKMTLIDHNLPGIIVDQVTRGDYLDSSLENKVKVAYHCDDMTTEENKYVSALITDANDKVLKYAKLSQYAPGEGEVELEVDPAFDQDGHKLVLFTEYANSGNETDLASTPVNISIPPKVIERIIVTPEYTSVDAGGDVTYTAKVVGAGADAEGNGGYLPLQDVEWTLEGNNSTATEWGWGEVDVNPTQMNVHVADNETSEEIKVIAISNEDPSVEGVGYINPFMVLNFDLQGGTCNGLDTLEPAKNLTAQTLIGGQAEAPGVVVLPDEENSTLVKDNAQFRGWYTEIGGEGEEYSNANPKNMPKSMTLYAAWSTNMGKGDFFVAKIDDQEYTGKQIKPEVRVSFGQTELVQGVDFTVSYTNNINVAKSTDGIPPTITVKGKGNYKESEVVKFSIVEKDLDSSDIQVTIQDKKYNKGNLISSDPVIKWGAKSLVKDKDYTVSYTKVSGSSTAATQVPVVIKGKGNFKGTIHTGFYIVPESKLLTAKGIKIEVTGGTKVAYSGEAQEPSIVVTDGTTTVNPSEYTVKYENNVKAGKAKIIVTGTGATYGGSKTVSFDITPKSLGDGIVAVADIKMSDIIGMQFLGEKVIPYDENIRIYDSTKEAFLVQNVDFTISYSGNEKVGTAKAIVSGKGNYTGKFVKEFEIAQGNLNNVALYYAIAPVKYDNGKAVTPKVKIDTGRKLLKLNKDYKILECTDNTEVTEDAKVTLEGMGAYTGQITKSFRIYQAADVSTLDIRIEDEHCVYDGMEQWPYTTITDPAREGRELLYGMDYTYKLSKNINAGTDTAVIEVTGMGTYTGKIKKTFSIKTMPLSSPDITATVVNQKVSSGNKPPVVELTTVVNGKVKKLTKGKDFDCTSWSDSTVVNDAAKVVLQGKNNFGGTLDLDYSIYSEDISKKLVISKVSARSYTGEQICPQVTVGYNNALLIENVDYKVTYGENTKVGTGTITVSGIGKVYGGSKTITFAILPKWLSWIVDKDIEDIIVPITENEDMISDNSISNNQLAENPEAAESFTIMCANEDNAIAGTTLTGISANRDAIMWKIDGQISADTEIISASATEAELIIAEDEKASNIVITAVNADDMTEIASKEIRIKYKVMIDLTGGSALPGSNLEESYVVSKYTNLIFDSSTVEGANNPVKPGFNFMGFYTEKSGQGTKFESGDYVLENMTLYAAWASTKEGSYTIIDIGDRPYTGSKITPIVSVFDGETKLTLNKDYKLTYKNNIAVADASDANAPQVIVTGMGNYTKTEICKFSIVGKDLSDDDVQITIKDGVYNKGKDVLSLPEVRVNGKKLKQNVDYLIDINNPEDLGAEPGSGGIEIYLTVVGIGGYSGSKEISYRIMENGYLLSDSNIKIAKISAETYTGGRIEPNISVTNAATGGTLAPGFDYRIEYLTNNVNVGKVKARLIGKNDYAGYKDVEFSIVKASLVDAAIAGISDQPYMKSGVTLEGRSLRVTHNGTVLREGIDYKTTYKNNKAIASSNDKKAPTVTITGMGNFKGTNKATFTIVGKNAYKLNVTVKDARAKLYNGSYVKVKPVVVVKDGKTTLANGTDYTVSYYNNTSPKESTEENAPYVIVTGKGSYFGNTQQYVFSIVESKSIASSQITVAMPLVSYTGDAVKPLPTITDTARKDAAGEPMVLELGVDYTLGYARNKNSAPAGDEKKSPMITIRGKGVYSGSRKQTFKISGKTVTQEMITIGDSFYNEKNGNAVIPSVVVKDEINGKMKTLKSGTDYTVSKVEVVSAPTATTPGKGKVEVTGINNYRSPKNTFEVKLYTQKLSSATTSAIPAQVYSGIQNKPSIKVFLNGKELVKDVDYQITYGENIKAGNGTVIISGTDTSIFGGTKTITFKILPKWLSWIVR